MRGESEVKYLGLDVGGTKIELAKFDENFQLVKSIIFSTQDFGIGSLNFLKSIEGIIADNLDQSVEKIGVSFRCIANEGVIVRSSLLGQGEINFPLEQSFSQKFDLPVRLENDVNAMAVAEGKFGKGRGIKNFILLNLGTGIRISHSHEAKIVKGYSGNAGEICQKRIIVSELGYKTYALEDFISGKGIANVYKEISGNKLSSKEVFAAILKDKKAQETIMLFTKYLAEFLAEVSYFHNPEVIIINGSLKKAAHIFLPEMERMYKKDVPVFFQAKKIEISNLDASACLGVVL